MTKFIIKDVIYIMSTISGSFDVIQKWYIIKSCQNDGFGSCRPPTCGWEEVILSESFSRGGWNLNPRLGQIFKFGGYLKNHIF
jgi:hypothetical protein